MIALSDLFRPLYRKQTVWHVQHRLRKSFRSFTDERAAYDYYESLKHAKTRRIRKLRPLGEMLREMVTAPCPILQKSKVKK